MDVEQPPVVALAGKLRDAEAPRVVHGLEPDHAARAAPRQEDRLVKPAQVGRQVCREHVVAQHGDERLPSDEIPRQGHRRRDPRRAVLYPERERRAVVRAAAQQLKHGSGVLAAGHD